MTQDLKEALKNRRSYYALSDKSPISDQEIEDIINFAITHVPSPFNSQSSRLVLLLGKQHKKLWEIVTETLQKIVSSETFGKTKTKIDTSFAAGYGTVLFFEDESVVRQLQKNFPAYKDNFPVWSHHTSAMHQLAVWTMLEEAGFGASLQHYNPLIDQAVRQTWNLSPDWTLIAEMPFGLPLQQPQAKEYKPLEERVKVFK